MSMFQALLADGNLAVAPDLYGTEEFDFSVHASAFVAARQTTLEIALTGVDRARSYSCWVLADNRGSGDQRIFGVANTSNANQQFGLFLDSQNTATANQNQRLGFICLDGSLNNIAIRSEKRFLKARWCHVVITYDGTELNTGLEMYLNGVLEATPLRSASGVYAGGVDVSTNRFQVSSVGASTRSFSGIIRDLCIWDHELNQTEVDELFNNGIPFDVNTASFYAADIVAYWPCHANLNCLNNATFNFGTINNIAVRQSPVDINYPVISFFNGIIGNTAYVAFGSLYVKDGLVHCYTRKGSTHLSDGDMVKMVFDPSDLLAATPVSAPTVVFSDTSDLRGVSAMEIANSVFLFNSRTNNGLNTYINADYWVSTDGTVGDAFGSPTVLATPSVGYTQNFYGKPIQGNAAQEWLVPYYEFNSTTKNSIISLWRTLTDGVTWNKLVMITDNTGKGYTETSAINCGGGKYLFLMRTDVTPFNLMAFTSSDNLATFSTPIDSGLVTSGGVAMADMALDPVGNLTAVWFDRAARFLGVSHSNPIDDLFADLTDWKNISLPWWTEATDSLDLGYPSIVYVDGFNLAICVSRELTATRADIYFCYGQFGTL